MNEITILKERIVQLEAAATKMRVLHLREITKLTKIHKEHISVWESAVSELITPIPTSPNDNQDI